MKIPWVNTSTQYQAICATSLTRRRQLLCVEVQASQTRHRRVEPLLQCTCTGSAMWPPNCRGVGWTWGCLARERYACPLHVPPVAGRRSPPAVVLVAAQPMMSGRGALARVVAPAWLLGRGETSQTMGVIVTTTATSTSLTDVSRNGTDEDPGITVWHAIAK